MYFKCFKRFVGFTVIMRKALMLCTVLLISGFLLFGFSGRANSACSFCIASVMLADSNIWEEAEDNFDAAIDRSFKTLQKFIVHDMWEQSILPAMMLSAEQLTTTAMQQAMAIGMFIDAESQLKAQLLLQEIRAKAHKDYHPSVGMCEFGSVMKSLAATERQGEITAVVLSQRSQDRQLGQRDSSGMYGNDLDKFSRINQFKRLFCNIKDRSDALIPSGAMTILPGSVTALMSLCSQKLRWDNAAFDKAARLRMNKDIDYFSLVDSPWSLSIDFTNKKILDTSATPNINNEDEEHILAMASNLYAHDTFPRIPARLLANNPAKELTTMQKAYMDIRSIVAKRSVAENSFYAIAAMKAEGSYMRDDTSEKKRTGPMSSRIYMEHILKELGVPAAETLKLLGENPSYYSQMEILTKKLYQNPDFYTNLYDKPANVERKTVALQAIKLMQKFDILKSFLRGEASTSILLELAVSDLQNEIEDQIQVVGVGGN